MNRTYCEIESAFLPSTFNMSKYFFCNVDSEREKKKYLSRKMQTADTLYTYVIIYKEREQLLLTIPRDNAKKNKIK